MIRFTSRSAPVCLLDFHCHILPHMDDGASTPTESLRMLRQEKDHGVSHICLTSHYYHDLESVDVFLERREEAYELLLSRVDTEANQLPQLFTGAEVAYFPGLSDEASLKDLRCGESNLILIEPPMEPFSERMMDELSEIRSGGLRPVIAHLDRYIRYLEDSSLILRAREKGLLVQINTSFFLQESWQELALEMLCCNDIDFVGTDSHNLTTRAPNFSSVQKVLRKHRLETAFQTMNRRALQLISVAHT